MELQGAYAEVLAALHGATVDDALWPRTSALIDDACGATGNALVVSDRFGDDSRIHFRAGYYGASAMKNWSKITSPITITVTNASRA